jgi:nucleoside-diphosphate-sugar epimerase
VRAYEQVSSAPERALVTGASGFIGTHVCERLRGHDVEIHGVSRRDPTEERAVDRWWNGNIADPSWVRRVVAEVRPDVIYHLAGWVDGDRAPAAVLPSVHHNVLGTVNILAAAHEVGCDRIVLAGSMEEPVRPGEAPGSPYAASKQAVTGYARMFHGVHGLPVVTLRVFMTYGPGQWDDRKIVPYVISSLRRGERPQLTSGERLVDWIYVSDVADAFVRAGVAPGIEGTSLDVGSGTQVSVRRLVEDLVELIDPTCEPSFGAIPDRPLETSNVANIERTRRLMGWEPLVALSEGLRRTVRWFERRGGLVLMVGVAIAVASAAVSGDVSLGDAL